MASGSLARVASAGRNGVAAAGSALASTRPGPLCRTRLGGSLGAAFAAMARGNSASDFRLDTMAALNAAVIAAGSGETSAFAGGANAAESSPLTTSIDANGSRGGNLAGAIPGSASMLPPRASGKRPLVEAAPVSLPAVATGSPPAASSSSAKASAAVGVASAAGSAAATTARSAFGNGGGLNATGMNSPVNAQLSTLAAN